MSIKVDNTTLTSFISHLHGSIEGLQDEIASSIRGVLNDLETLLNQKENINQHSRIQKNIHYLMEYTEKLPEAKKISLTVNQLFQSECKIELFLYLKNQNEDVPEEAKERIRQTVEKFDQSEEILNGPPLVFHLANSNDPFLRSLVSLCLDKGADPAFITRVGGLSLIRILALKKEEQLIRKVADLLSPEDLKKVLLAQPKKKNKCALELFNNMHLLVELMKKAGISPAQPLQDSSLFLFYLQKELSNYFWQAFHHQMEDEQLQKALSFILSTKKEDNYPFLQPLIARGIYPQSDLERKSFREMVECMLLKETKEINDSSLEELEKVYLNLIQSKNLPLFLEPMKLAVDALPHSTPLLQEAISHAYPEEILKALREHLPLLISIYNELSVARSTADFIELTKNIIAVRQLLNDPQFAQLLGFDDFKSKMLVDLDLLEKEVEEREKAAMKWIEKTEKQQPIASLLDPSKINLDRKVNMGDREELSIHFQRDVFALLMLKEKHGLFKEIAKQVYKFHVRETDNRVFHFLLDKMMVNNYEQLNLSGSVAYLLGTDLFVSIEQEIFSIDQDSTLPKEKKEHFKKVLKDVAQSLALLAESSRDPSLLPTLFQNSCSPLLINVGFKRHSALIALYPHGDKTTALLFNTGGGVPEYHPLGADQFRFQTYLCIEEIPTESISKEDLLQLVATKELETIDPLYQLFFNLAKRGKLLPPSTNPYDYEMAQSSGTCAAQCLMAFFRYHIRKELGEEALESMGIYKFIKARVLQNFTQERLPFLNSTRELAEERVKEIMFQRRLWNLSQDGEKWKIAQEQVVHALKKSKLPLLQGNKEMPVFARYFILERNLRVLAKQEEKAHVELGELTSFFDLLVEKKSSRQARYLSSIKKARAAKDIGQLNSYFSKSRWSDIFKDTTKAWLEEDFHKDPTFWTALSEKGESGRELYDKAKRITPALFEV